MKWPWTKKTDERVEQAEKHARLAEYELQHIESQWPHVRQVVGEARLHRELNGWTATVKTIFGGRS